MTTFAAPLQIPSLPRANIGIQKIFLSSDGVNTTPAGTTNISLDGTNGNVRIAGFVQIPHYACALPTGCVLTTMPGTNGTLGLTGASAVAGAATAASSELFTKSGDNPLDPTSYDVYFADPTPGPSQVTGTANDNVKVRI